MLNRTRSAISASIGNAKHVLVLAVGGGNDTVSTLLLQKQLIADYGYAPDTVDIVAVLPDCLDYHGMLPTAYPLVSVITPESGRSVQGSPIEAFPEKMLAAHKADVHDLPVNLVFGMSMREGSVGIARALDVMLSNGTYDLVLAIDVGGDFIAVEENIEVLSPMMDGYMLHALRDVRPKHPRIPFVYSVFGLGTDGESTPEMLHAALARIPDRVEGTFEADALGDVIRLYRDKVEPNRYSRTADFTIRQILGEQFPNPTPYRARFHVKTKEGFARAFMGYFEHYQSPEFFGKYFLFSDLQQVSNPYAFACSNGLEWFVKVQKRATMINHELNGQSYSDIGALIGDDSFRGKSLFFGTMSRKFEKEDQDSAEVETMTAVEHGIYDVAIEYRPDLLLPFQFNSVHFVTLNDDLMISSKDPALLDRLISIIRSHQD
jgi:hypothetical protein